MIISFIHVFLIWILNFFKNWNKILNNCNNVYIDITYNITSLNFPYVTYRFRVIINFLLHHN